MAVKLPDYTVLGDRPDARSGRVVSSVDTTAPGEALAQAGKTVANIGFEMADAQAELADARARSGYLVEATKLDAERDKINDPAQLDAFGTKYQDTAQRYAESIPDGRRKERFLLSIAPDTAKRATDAGKMARGIRTDQSVAATNQRLVELRESALRSTNPEERKQLIQAANDELTALEKAGQIDATKAQETRRNWTQGFIEEDTRQKRDELIRKGDYTGAQRLVEEAGGRKALPDRIIGAESGGNPNAKNPKSSATGAGQFTDGAWMDIIKSDRPDLIEGRNAAEVLELRKDPKLSRQMVDARNRRDAAYLRNAGLEPTDGAIYLAFFAGPAGAEKLLKADPNASAESVLGSEAVKANPFLKGMTASGVAAWADKKMGLAPAGPLTLESERWRKLNDETISDIAQARKRTADSDRFSGIMSGSIDFNPYNKDDRAAVDDAFEAGGSRQSVRSMDPTVISDISGVAQKFSYVPAPVAEELSDMVMNGSADQKAYALQATSAILANSPNAMDKTDNGKALTEKSRDFEAMVRTGIKPADAVKRIDEMASPEFQAKRGAVKETKDFKDFLKARDASEISGVFDTWNSFAPEVGATPAERDQMTADYRAAAEYHYLRPGMSPELAVAAAQEDFKRQYGVSSVTGSPRVMRYPPEKLYPTVNGGHEYIGEQAAAAASEVAGTSIPVSDIILQPVRQTESDLKQGRLPRYALLYYKDKDGQRVLETIPGMSFGADPAAAGEKLSVEHGQKFQGMQERSDKFRDLRSMRSDIRRRALSGENIPADEFQNRRNEILGRGQPAPSGGLTLPGAEPSSVDPMGNQTGVGLAP